MRHTSLLNTAIAGVTVLYHVLDLKNQQRWKKRQQQMRRTIRYNFRLNWL